MVRSATIESPSLTALGLAASSAPTMSKTDPLIARVQAGEASAFQELFRTHRDMVSRVVFRVMGSSPEIEDVVQDVFIHVFRSIHRFRGDSKFTTWLYRLTVNVTKMHLRRKKSRPRLVELVAPPKERDSQAPARPDELAEQQVRVQALRALVEKLSEKKRTVLVLHDFDGMSAAEIADIVDAPVLTVRTRLFYARKELYAAIAQHPDLAPSIEHLIQKLPGGGVKMRKREEEKPT